MGGQILANQIDDVDEFINNDCLHINSKLVKTKLNIFLCNSEVFDIKTLHSKMYTLSFIYFWLF